MDTRIKHLDVGIPYSKNVGDKLQLIAMICYVTNVFNQKKNVSAYEAIKICTKGECIDNNIAESLAIISEWFSEGCTEFPNLGVNPKEMPKKITELIKQLMPF